MRIGIVLICGMLMASPLSAHPEGLESSRPADQNKVVCKSEDVIGSHLQTQKQCMTVAQWTQLKHETSNTLDRMQGHWAYQCPPKRC